MYKFLFILFFIPSMAFAQHGKVIKTFYKANALNAVALNAGASSLTFYIDYAAIKAAYEMRGPATLGFDMYFDYAATAGTITTTCTVGATQATATRSLTTCTVSSGTCTLNNSGIIVHSSMSADTYWFQELGLPVSVPVIKCVVAHGGSPGATDKITVSYYLSAE